MKTSSLLPLVLLAACSSKSDSEEVTDSGEVATDSGEVATDSGDTEVELSPENGDYLAQLVAFTLDECEMEAGEWSGLLEEEIAMAFTREGSNLRLTLLEDGKADGPPVACTSMEDHFMCAMMNEDMELGGESREAVMSRSIDVMVAWETNTDIAGSVEFNMDCTGADCKEVLAEYEMANTPCQTSLSIAGSKTE
jgi:hypothetical protein